MIKIAQEYGPKPTRVKSSAPVLARNALNDLMDGAKGTAYPMLTSISRCPNCDHPKLVKDSLYIWCECCAWNADRPTV